MAATRDPSVSLPADLAEPVQAKAAAGGYAGESEVIGEGLRALQGREDDRPRGRIAVVYDRMTSHSASALSIAELRRASSGEASRSA